MKKIINFLKCSRNLELKLMAHWNNRPESCRKWSACNEASSNFHETFMVFVVSTLFNIFQQWVSLWFQHICGIYIYIQNWFSSWSVVSAPITDIFWCSSWKNLLVPIYTRYQDDAMSFLVSKSRTCYHCSIFWPYNTDS